MAIDGTSARSSVTPVPDPSEWSWGVYAWTRMGIHILLRRPYEMLVPFAVASIALTVAMVPVLALNRANFSIVNGDLAFTSFLGTGLRAFFIGWLLVAFMTGITIMATMMIMTESVVRGTAVPAKQALRESLRRLPTLIPLILIFLLIVLVPTAVGLGLLLAGVVSGLVMLVYLALLLFLLPLVHVLPVAVFERRGVFGTLRRTRQIVRRHRSSAALVPLLFMFLPGATHVLLAWLSGWLPTQMGAVILQILGSAVTIIVTAAGTATLSVATLARIDHLKEWTGPKRPDALVVDADALDDSDDDAVLQADGGARARRRPWPAIGSVLLTGVLYASFLQVNPVRLTTLTDHSLAGDDFSLTSGQLHVGPGERPFSVTEEGLSLFVRSCTVSDCANSEVSEQRGTSVFPGMFDSVQLPDGRAVVALWYEGLESLDQELRLFACAADGCQPGTVLTGENGRKGRWLAPSGTALVTSRALNDWALATAIAHRPDGGFVVAYVAPIKETRDYALGLVSCDDFACRVPRTVQLARMDSWGVAFDSRALDIAVAPDGRVVVAAFNEHDHSVMTAACDTLACRRPVIAHPSRGESGGFFFSRGEYQQGISMVIPPNGLPILTYSGENGAWLLKCRTFECDVAVNEELTGTSKYGATPSLAVDGEGRSLIAAYASTPVGDIDLILITCRDARCVSRSTVPLQAAEDFPGPLDLKVGPDGRPRILWADAYKTGNLRLLTCSEPRCGAD
jgi:hypothetical protein